MANNFLFIAIGIFMFFGVTNSDYNSFPLLYTGLKYSVGGWIVFRATFYLSNVFKIRTSKDNFYVGK